MSTLSPFGLAVPVIGIDSSGKAVRASEQFIRWMNMGLEARVGGVEAPTIIEVDSNIAALTTELHAAESTMVTATYDATHDNRVLSLRNSNGADLAIDELMCWDIHYWLTRAEIEDSRNPTGPTLNLTSQIQFALDSLVAKFSTYPAPNKPQASMAGTLRFHHSYMVDGLDVHIAIGIAGDNMRDTIFVQSDTPNGHMIRGLARNGANAGSRAPYARFSDFTILMSSSQLAPDGSVIRGIMLYGGSTDPEQAAIGHQLQYNAAQMERVTIVGGSGACLWIEKTRHAPKVRFCFFTGGGGALQIDGVATTDGSGQYEPNVYDNSDSDSEYLHCGSGGGHGDSYYFVGGETTQVNGGDCWVSKNPDLGYVSIRATGMDYLLIRGLDINGKVYYKGDGLIRSSQFRMFDNNFRFRKGSFGVNDDDGTPLPLDSFVEVEDGVGAFFMGNTYTPYYTLVGGVPTIGARTQFVYKPTGATVIVAYDRFPSITSIDWPAGQDLMVAPTVKDTLTSNWDKIILCAGLVGDDYQSVLTRYLRFVDGLDCGIWGRVDGLDAPAGTIGETGVQPLNSVVALTTATAADIGSKSLPPGSWHVYGSQQFQASAATVTGIRGAITVNSGTIPTSSTVNYGRRALNLTGVSGDFERFDFGPIPINVPPGPNVPVYSTVRADFSAGTVGAWGDLRAVRIG